VTKPPSKPDEKPRTHRWFRSEHGVVVRRDEPGPIHTDVPRGDPGHPDTISADIRAALAGWPVTVLRVVAVTHGRAKIGRHPGRWVRMQLGRLIDERMWSSRGPRASDRNCGAYRLLGRHAAGPKIDGEAWAPLVVRGHAVPEGTLDEGSRFRFELAIAGADAVGAVPQLVAALGTPLAARGSDPEISFPTVQALRLEEDELIWRKASPDERAPRVPLDRLPDPRIRRGRLVCAFQSATPVQRRGEEGTPTSDFAFVMDRMTRSFGTWMGRTGHKGPRLPVAEILRVAATAETATENLRIVQVPAAFVAAEGARTTPDERVGAMLGEITWTGHFEALAPLLQAAHWVGMGPGRQHGLGQVAIR
jgi:hypothetical protein